MINNIEQLYHLNNDCDFHKFKEVVSSLKFNHNRFKFIHIAGTNGKGSVCNYLEEILVEGGKKVGMLTSPHFFSPCERVRFNKNNIDNVDFIKIVNKYWDIIQENKLGWFQITIIVALCLFDKKDVEYVIWETGIGGRLDSTNIIENKILSAITSIGIDHQELLGETIEDIAYEKYGIKKPGIPLLLGDGSTYNQKKVASFLNDDEIIELSITKEHYKFCASSNIIGYQISNSFTAKQIALYLNFDIDEINSGLVSAKQWPGRLEIINNVMFDGAHNISGITNLASIITNNPIIIFSCLENKDYRKMINILKQKGKVYLTNFSSFKKSINAKKVAKELNVLFIDDWEKIINDEDNFIFTGSIHFVASVLKRYKAND